jgi:hypothetical protein
MTYFPPTQTWFVLLMSLTQLISWGTVFYGFSVFMTPVELALGLNRVESSTGFSLALLTEGLLALLVGQLIGKGRERAVMTVGSIVLGAALMLFSQVKGIFEFYMVWLLLGAGMSATLYTPAFAVITRRYPTNFRRSIITLTFLGGLASTVFIPLMLFLNDLFGWRQSLVILGLLHWTICAPLHASLLKHVQQFSPSRSKEIAKESVRQFLKKPAFILILIFCVLMLGVTAAIPAHMLSLLREAHINEEWVALIPASIGIVQVLGRVLLLIAERHIDNHQVNRWIPCLIPLSLIFLLFGRDTVWGCLLFVVFYGIGNGLFTIVKGTAIAQYVSLSHAAQLNGAMGLPQALSRAFFPMAIGWLWSPERGYDIGLWFLFFACVIAIFCIWKAQILSEKPRLNKVTEYL